MHVPECYYEITVQSRFRVIIQKFQLITQFSTYRSIMSGYQHILPASLLGCWCSESKLFVQQVHIYFLHSKLHKLTLAYDGQLSGRVHPRLKLLSFLSPNTL